MICRKFNDFRFPTARESSRLRGTRSLPVAGRRGRGEVVMCLASGSEVSSDETGFYYIALWCERWGLDLDRSGWVGAAVVNGLQRVECELMFCFTNLFSASRGASF